MKTLSKEVAAGVAFTAIGVAVALAVVFVQAAEATPDPGVSYVLRGVSPLAGQQCSPYKDDPLWGEYWIDGWHTCWHLTEPGYPAIDYTRTDGQTEGSHVYLEYEGDFQLFKIMPYEDDCTGVRAEIYRGSYDPANYRGDLHYLHIEPNEYWFNKEVPYQLIWIGDVAEEDDPDCAWTGFHLHQSADWSGSTPFYSNKFRDPSQGENWEHAILWEPGGADSDGDDFINQDELYIDTDPFDDCADTGIPNDEHPDPWPPDFDDNRVVEVTDAIIFVSAFPSALGSPNYDARCEMDPDGVIDVFDAVIFLSYFPGTCA